MFSANYQIKTFRKAKIRNYFEYSFFCKNAHFLELGELEES